MHTLDDLVLFNEKSEGDGEPLIYFDRTFGGDIGWPSSETVWGQIPGKIPGLVEKVF